MLLDHTSSWSPVVLGCFSCFVTTRFPGPLWSGGSLLAFRPHAFLDPCGLGLLFLLSDHTPSRVPVVQGCFSCFRTTRFPGPLWSGRSLLAFRPHAFPDACGPEDHFLPLDHTRHTQAKINGVPGPNDSQLCWPECGPGSPQEKTSRDGSFICYAK